jgi:hypothetical protein
MTRCCSAADRQRQQETGFNHYYVKPVNMEKLIELFMMVRPKGIGTVAD